MKNRLYLFIKEKILKVLPQDDLSNNWLKWIFFPIDMFYCKYYKINDWKYFFPFHITIYGIKYPLSMFKDLSSKVKNNVEESITFLKEKNGGIIIKRDYKILKNEENKEQY